jgi:hypothetical protein
MKKLKLTISGEVKIFDLPENGEYRCEVVERYVPKVGHCVKISFKKTNYEYFCKISQTVQKEILLKSAVNEIPKVVLNLSLYYDYRDIVFTQITPEELKAKYAEAGYDWDYELDVVKPLKWIPKNGDTVWYLNLFCKPAKVDFDNNIELKIMLEKGLLFPTEAECQKFADHCLKYFDKK